MGKNLKERKAFAVLHIRVTKGNLQQHQKDRVPYPARHLSAPPVCIAAVKGDLQAVLFPSFIVHQSACVSFPKCHQFYDIHKSRASVIHRRPGLGTALPSRTCVSLGQTIRHNREGGRAKLPPRARHLQRVTAVNQQSCSAPCVNIYNTEQLNNLIFREKRTS